MFFSRISFKLVLIIGISLLGMIALAPIALSTLRAQMIADRQAKTQHMVDVGYGILAHYQKLESRGEAAARAGAGRRDRRSRACVMTRSSISGSTTWPRR